MFHHIEVPGAGAYYALLEEGRAYVPDLPERRVPAFWEVLRDSRNRRWGVLVAGTFEVVGPVEIPGWEETAGN